MLFSAQVELPNLEAGIAAAQEADVFIGMHGGHPLPLGASRAGMPAAACQRMSCKAGRVLLPACVIRCLDPALPPLGTLAQLGGTPSLRQ